jgi:hypothetical protein
MGPDLGYKEGRGKMIHAHIDKSRAVPAWAALGAPLIGIPLMVALLALAGPSDRTPADAHDALMSTETVEAQAVAHDIDEEAATAIHSLRNG